MNVRDSPMLIRVGTIEEAHKVFMSVPELDQYLSLEEMTHRLKERYLAVVAQINGNFTGFKIGYPESDTNFYSWLGGVIPKYRNSGIAQGLLEFQEKWAAEAGFKRVSVKSMNRFPSMLRLLIKNGYEIERVDFYGIPESERILLSKNL